MPWIVLEFEWQLCWDVFSTETTCYTINLFAIDLSVDWKNMKISAQENHRKVKIVLNWEIAKGAVSFEVTLTNCNLTLALITIKIKSQIKSNYFNCQFQSTKLQQNHIKSNRNSKPFEISIWNKKPKIIFIQNSFMFNGTQKIGILSIFAQPKRLPINLFTQISFRNVNLSSIWWCYGLIGFSTHFS